MITSFQNTTVKQIKRLQQKKFRQKEGRFLIEGLRVVAAALESDYTVESLVWCDDLLVSDFGRNLLHSSQLPTIELSSDVFRSVSERDNPAGLAAVVKTRSLGLEDLVVSAESTFVALQGISDPGNLGTIIRTADAAGANGVILIGTTTDPIHPTAIKASMGTLFHMPIVTVRSAEKLLTFCQTHSIQTVATSAKTTTDYTNAPYQSPTLLLMGSERQGLSDELLDSADIAVKIPMRGHASSLNLSVATGLLLYELRRSQ